MNRPLLAPNVPIDLSNCDLEPIHIPSSVQPHGMLLAALSSDLRIVYASENTESFLGVAPRYVLERTLNDILGPDAVDSIEHALGEDLYVPKDIRTYTFPLCGDQRFDVTAHRTQGLLCLELELSNENRRWDLLSSRLEGAMRTLGLAKTLPDLCAATAPVLRALTGYDRVMVYKFDADGHGEVVAEDKAPEMEPFLGLHYPATDIPAQARKLYLQQRLRTIVDINYVPVPLLGNRSFIDNTPLDMTYCGLRSVSPVHVEYLQNMGVGASLAVSLIVGGELWGMILGHHRTPRHLAPESRALCDLLGQLVSLLLGATQQSDEAADERRKEGLLEVLTTSIESGLDLEQSLLGSKDALLALVRADGAIFRIGGRLSLIGITPGPDEASSLLNAFEERMEGGTASSNEIGTILPAFSHFAPSASGGLLVALGARSDVILWLRGQIVEPVRWAGQPDASKHSFDGSFRLCPRKSFAVSEQIQCGRSLSWRTVEIEAALSFERIVSKALLVQLTLKYEYDRFRLLADLMPQLVWTTLPDGKPDYFNEQWHSYTGISSRELIDSWQETIHPADLPNCLDHWARTVATACDYQIEYRIKRGSDGAYRWHLTRASPLRNDRDEIIQWIGTSTDVDDQRRARNELEEQVAERTLEIARSQQQLQAVIDGATQISIIATNAEGLITLFNSGASNMLGYTSQEVVGKHKPALFHLASEVTARGLELTAETGREVNGFGIFAEKTSNGQHEEREWTYVRKDGSHLTVSLVVTGLRDTGGMIVGFLGVAMDVTERKRAEDAARASDEHFRLIVETVEDYALIMLDPDGQVVSWNLGGERIKGYKSDEIIGKHFSTFYTREDIERQHPEAELRIAAETGSYSEEGWRVRKDGSRFLAEVFIAAIRNNQGKLLGFAKVVHDITSRKEAEQELEDNRLEILKGNLLLQAVNKELEEFAYVASHDLKAPLRVIDNASKWLEEDLAEHLTADARESMKLVRGRVKRMERLLDDLLEYARIGRTPGGPPGEVVAGDILISDVLELLPTKNFTFVIDPLFSTIQLRRMPLQHILSNLIDNAIKHHDKPQGCIEVTVKEDDDYYEFMVRDDGPGIPVQYHDQIFKMFQTLRPRDQVEGSGMGLAIARKTVELFGGVLTVESVAGRGSAFRFTWPKEQRIKREESSIEFLNNASPDTAEHIVD